MTKRRDGEPWRLALQATSLGWDLALPIFGGVLIGYALDRSVSTQYIFTLGLLLLGIGVGFYNVIRSIQRVEEHSRRESGRDVNLPSQEEEGTDR